jgi:hypothetical protein
MSIETESPTQSSTLADLVARIDTFDVQVAAVSALRKAADLDLSVLANEFVAATILTNPALTPHAAELKDAAQNVLADDDLVETVLIVPDGRLIQQFLVGELRKRVVART